ncbi:DUF6083 domain-containing protein [Streptomyces sp. NPDC006435]|uniref:DUF6083 domain-containing protein n=1 Tax=Streptomyces sp. NPDC006435 TaxID=3154300 RepID=UPI00339F12F3
MVIARDSPSRLLRSAQSSRCQECGNSVDRYATTGHRHISLHPVEVPAALTPPDDRWHLASGIAHPTDGGDLWCRLAHRAVCPAATEPSVLPSALGDIRRRLALHTRRLIDTGTFTPGNDREARPHNEGICRPARPVVQLLYTRYIAAAPVENIQCVAQNTCRTRCANRVLAPGTLPGRWTLVPATPRRRGTQQLALPTTDFLVYDLGSLPFGEQVRWRTQRCPAHAVTSGAPDLALPDWELFDPLLHHAYLATRLPDTARRA